MPSPKETWKEILKILDEKLQYALLDRARSVVDVKIEGEELHLYVAGSEAAEFFKAEINQQRLIILSRPLITLEKIRVKEVAAEPLP